MGLRQQPGAPDHLMLVRGRGAAVERFTTAPARRGQQSGGLRHAFWREQTALVFGMSGLTAAPESRGSGGRLRRCRPRPVGGGRPRGVGGVGRQARLKFLHERLQYLHARQQIGERQFQFGVLAFQLRNAEILGINGFDRSIEFFPQRMSVPASSR